MEDIPNIRKIDEFEALLQVLEEGSVAHWQDIANALGVDKDTIKEWRKHPKARQAQIKGIEYALKSMESAGKKDWRMWEAKLKMLGMAKEKNADNVDQTGVAGVVIYRPERDYSP